MKSCTFVRGWLVAAFFGLTALAATGQANLPIYTDHLVNGFQDWSWAADNLSYSAVVHSNEPYSIAVYSEAYQALSFYHADFDSSLYTGITFWINGGSGGQVIQVNGLLSLTATPNSYLIPALPSNSWQHITIPLTSLGVANKTNFDRFWLQVTGSGTTNSFYVSDVQLAAKPAPALTHINVNAAQTLRPVDSRWFGINTAVWDNQLDDPETISLIKEMGLRILRFPGGSLSDEYHWMSNRSGTNKFLWQTSFANFAHVATNVGAQAMITVNYGTGTPEEAAAWVRNSNVTNHYGFKYWEIGNELYGTWETDSNTFPHDAYTYAVRAQQFIQEMKAVDPTIKIGVVVTPGETSDSNGYTAHPAYNPRTKKNNYGWTAVLLTTLKSLGVTPDFLIHHRYPEYTDQESDPFLLQGTGGWAGDVADLRQQVTDYFGTGGTNIEILCTENNSNSGAQGKQSVSLVNAIYYADSLAQLMQTEINGFFWWDLRNGLDYSGNQDPILYGWRPYGDIGTLNGLGTSLANRYPHFFAIKLLQYFARPGDSTVAATTDFPLLTAYAARRTNGSLTLLVINKDPASSFNAQIALNGFAPSTAATVKSYGMAQDNAAELGAGSADVAQTTFNTAGTNFTDTFPPYSISLITLSPSAPSLTVMPAAPGTFVFQLNGQPNTPYVLQNSANGILWTSILTNTVVASSASFTNSIDPAASLQFWRAVWQP